VSSSSFKIENHLVNLTCSIGISLFPEHSDSKDGLIKHADTAMYQVKIAGKANYK